MTPILPAFAPSLSLAQQYYMSADVFAKEMVWLRHNMWFLAGHESQIPNEGDYFLYQFAADSIIIVRGAAGEIRAHLNVCRHRGSRICTRPMGTTRVLSCPYHAWAYSLDGNLLNAPLASRDFDRSSYALVSCHVRVQAGLIFICFAEAPQDFSEYIGPFLRELELQDLGRAKIAKRAVFSAQANWKLVVQNNLECCHCRPAHPAYSAAHPGFALGAVDDSGVRGLYAQVQSDPVVDADELDRNFMPISATHDSKFFPYLNRQFIGNNVVTESANGKPVAPLMGRNSFNGVQTQALPSPFTSMVLNPDHAVIYSFTPRSLRRTDMEVIWLVIENAIEGDGFDVDKMTRVWETTLREDKVLAENTQLGVESTGYRPGPYLPGEAMVGEFDRWYLQGVISE